MTNLFILSALYACLAPPAGPDPNSVYIEKITTGGDGCPSPAAVATTISEGILQHAAPATGATGAPVHHQQGMPKFPHLSDVERQSLALYVMSLRSQSTTR